MEAGEAAPEARTEHQVTEKYRISSPDRAQQIWREMREEREHTGPVSRLPTGIVSTRPKRRRTSAESSTILREAAMSVTGELLPYYQGIPDPEVQQVPSSPSPEQIIMLTTVPNAGPANRVDSPRAFSNTYAELADRLGRRVERRIRSTPHVEKRNSIPGLAQAKVNLAEEVAKLRQSWSEDEESIIRRKSQASSGGWLTRPRDIEEIEDGGEGGEAQREPFEPSEGVVTSLNEDIQSLIEGGSGGAEAQVAE